MSERRWIQAGEVWKEQYIDDDPPPGLVWVADKLKELITCAEKNGITIVLGSLELRAANCMYIVKEPVP